MQSNRNNFNMGSFTPSTYTWEREIRFRYQTTSLENTRGRVSLCRNSSLGIFSSSMCSLYLQANVWGQLAHANFSLFMLMGFVF
jgi:hypothetical protein